jgi:hypothetical protein
MVMSPTQKRSVDCTVGRSHHHLIGPWQVKVNGQLVEFNALTCIGTASNLVELICFDHKTATHTLNKFTQSWLCQYSCPKQCLHDKEGEFIGQNFQ